MSTVRSMSRSLFSQRQALKKAVIDPSAAALVDPDALYTVTQCVNGNYSKDPQCVPLFFIQSLRDASFVMDVDYELHVAPYFFSLEPYERCVYMWTNPTGGWLILAFDSMRRALLTIVGAPRIDKLVGAFPYSMCAERNSIRLANVGPYAEILLEPHDNSTDVIFTIPELNVSMILTNQTPQRLRTEA
jgi:hypothetical protein